MRKVGSIEVNEHPAPVKWAVGMLVEYGNVPVFVEWIATGAYAVTVAGNYMEGETGMFYNLSSPAPAFLFETLSSAFQAFKKFYG